MISFSLSNKAATGMLRFTDRIAPRLQGTRWRAGNSPSPWRRGPSPKVGKTAHGYMTGR